MSAGHRKQEEPDALAEQRFRLAQTDPQFMALVHRQIHVNFDYEIPYLAGYSLDGHTIYIDRDFRKYNLLPGLITHEIWEKAAIDRWHLPYMAAHHIAILAENQAVRTLLRLDPKKYNDMLEPDIKANEEDPKWVPLPLDIDRTPYKGSKWYDVP